MGLLRFAGDVWNQAVGGIQKTVGGKMLDPRGVVKDVLSDAAEAFVPVDFDRWGARKGKAESYLQGKPVSAEVSHQGNKAVNAVREPLVQRTVTEGAKNLGVRGITPAVGMAVTPLLGADVAINGTGDVLNAVSQATTGQPMQHHSLQTARAMDEGRSLGDVWEDGDWNTEMPRRIERAREVFDPSRLEFGITELMHGN